jgi:hypothetical protein
MKIQGVGIVLLSIFMMGCAVGNTYDYDGSAVDLPVQGQGKLGLAVLDMRPYILSGDKDPSFVGLQRGGFANPFEVHTDSGNPLTQDMAAAIGTELKTNGFEVVDIRVSTPSASVVAEAVQRSGAPRSVVLTVSKWKTDAYMNLGLTYDLTLEVFDASANQLADANISGHKEKLGGAGMESTNSDSAANAFSAKVGRLFNNPGIKAALTDSQ